MGASAAVVERSEQTVDEEKLKFKPKLFEWPRLLGISASRVLLYSLVACFAAEVALCVSTMSAVAPVLGSTGHEISSGSSAESADLQLSRAAMLFSSEGDHSVGAAHTIAAGRPKGLSA